VTPLVPLLAGVAALAAGYVVLRSFGPRYRIGRLLATTPLVSVDEAIALANGGHRAYVRVFGRIDSESEFEGPAHEPLVLRLTRFQQRVGGRWRTYELGREVVPFVINEGLSSIAVDGAAIDDGLIVVPRVAAGTAAEAGDRAPEGATPDRPVRAIVEQVTSVDHATVLGVPTAAAGAARLSAGLGRPLVLTNLDQPEAMRVLVEGQTLRPRIAAVLLAVGIGLLIVALAWWLLLVVPDAVAAASPEPTRPPANDPRSSGEGPGLVGAPAQAILAVFAIALLAILGTLVYVRLTRPKPGPR
jgi:hypothetical protein